MKTNPRDFALQLGALGALYITLSFLLVLIFGIINILYPDAVDSYWQIEQAQSSIRLGFAITIVFFPTYLVLTRLVNKHRRTESSGAYLGLTKWLIYLSLLVGGGVLLGDLVALIMNFLEGEITIRFILKALAVLVVIGAAFAYYLLDAKSYWIQREQSSIRFGIVSAMLITLILVVSLLHIDTPQQVREIKLDNQQVGDLQDMQWRIEDHYRVNSELPTDISVLYVNTRPQAPENRSSYQYAVTGEKNYQLCANFAHPSNQLATQYTPIFEKNNNWEHQVGEWCFERTIDDTYRQ